MLLADCTRTGTTTTVPLVTPGEGLNRTRKQDVYPAKELIERKRDGRTLERAEIEHLVAGISSGSVTDAQLGAFAMATWFRGMSADEQTALTLAMRDSGRVLQWPDLPGPVLDKHSTGGVGDLVSLILGPVIAACGGYVPMISGRGLGHTGGTLDKLESIPGLSTAQEVAQLQRLVRQNGLAIVGQSADLVPADRRLYAVRDVTATVSSPPLIVASILSKKLAEGLDALVMDIKFGSGAFMESPEQAWSLAGELCGAAAAAALPCHALITDMGQPLAWSAGNALEVREAIRFLSGESRHARLLQVVTELCVELLLLGGLAGDSSAAHEQVNAALESGRAAERFAAMVAGQGGPRGLLENPDEWLPVAAVVRPVFATDAGVVSHVDMRAIGRLVVNLGGGRQRAEDTVDPAVGLSDLTALGRTAGPQDPLACLHASSESDWELAAAALRAACEIGDQAPDAPPVVRGRAAGDTQGKTHG